jgi:glycosyltransferase involved in cell wall biosynthesis
MTYLSAKTYGLRLMAVILFYSPFNQRSRDTESLMIGFRHQGHKVISLSQQEGLVIHDFLRTHGVETYSRVLPGPRSGWWYYLRHLLYFIRFCYIHRVDVVYSHLEPANFVASLGQYFIRAKTYLCRHHIDEGQLYRFDKDLYYRLTYRLARNIIVVSEHARRYMVAREGIPGRKIKHINLAYDFGLYGQADRLEVQKIRDRYPAEILLLAACRFTAFKRPDLAIRTVRALTDRGLNVTLILLGQGEMKNDLQALATELCVEGRVAMPGYVSNVLDYMAAADFFLHPSLLDSSCVAVKEAGLVRLPVVVCQGVGDFDDYLVHERNGFSVHKDHFVDEAAALIVKNYHDKNRLALLGENLRKSVLDLFSVENVIRQYDALNNTR